MTDTSGGNSRLDGLVNEVKQAVQQLQTALQPKLQELGDQVQQALNTLSTKIDEVQAAAQQRQQGQQ